MGVSLVFTAARGGMLFTAALSLLALLLSGISVGQVLAAAFGGALLLAGVYLGTSLIFPELLSFTESQLAREGLESNRFETWTRFLRILADHPFGVGLLPENMRPIAPRYGTPHTTAHNIYLDQAVKMGVQGLFAFALLVGHILWRNWRGLRSAAEDPRRRRVLVYALLTLLGFLVGGLVEPIYNNGTKLNEVFWVLCGVSYAVSARALARAPSPASEPLRSFAPARRPTVANG
jgi:O-antigen ligase